MSSIDKLNYALKMNSAPVGKNPPTPMQPSMPTRLPRHSSRPLPVTVLP